MLYNIVLVSAVQWSEPGMCIHIFPPFWTFLPPLPLSHRAQSWAPCAIQTFLQGIHTGGQEVHEKMLNITNYAAAKSLQSCVTLCDPIDGSPQGSPVTGTLQARTLEWVAISFSNAWKWKVKVKSLSCVQLLATLWTTAYQAPLSMGFSRQEYWSGVPLPSPAFNMVLTKSYRRNSFFFLILFYF